MLDRRASHRIPLEVSNALLELEDLARTDERLKDTGGLEHIQAVVNTGGARDRVAGLVLDILNGGQNGTADVG